MDMNNTVTILQDGDEFLVRWDSETGDVAGLVPLLTRKHAEALAAQLTAGGDPARALRRVLRPKRRPSVKATIKASFTKNGKLGGLARAKNLTSEQRKQIATDAVNARWAKRAPKPDARREP